MFPVNLTSPYISQSNLAIGNRGHFSIKTLQLCKDTQAGSLLMSVLPVFACGKKILDVLPPAHYFGSDELTDGNSAKPFSGGH